MLGKYLKVNGRQYPNPVEYVDNFENNETVNVSEAGTDLVASLRLLKLNATMTFQVSKRWMLIIKEDCSLLKSTIDIDGVTFDGRLRLTNATLEPDSELTEGYWTLSVTFIER